ncbi:MAG TPA: hypothetical protein VG676_13570 [Chitinophagaceae bacterium]|jgi:hypothetical protein|nr:hypothetical protein [Chitinophagaceae bacterium]
MQKKKEIKWWLIGIILFMLISNILPLKGLFGFIFNENYYRYSNGDGSFTFTEIPFKQRLYNLNPHLIKIFSDTHPGNSDAIVYRLFSKNPLYFWRWGEYFYDKRYKLPYKSWQEIRKKRGYDLKYSNNWQDF